MDKPVLSINNLYMDFNLNAGFFARNDKRVYAVNDVSFELKRGETYGIVGESGCGKTTTAKLISRMYKPTGGEIIYHPVNGEDKNIFKLEKEDLKLYREKVKYVFQDPSRSLNPRMNILQILTSGLKYSHLWNGKDDAKDRAVKILEEVGLSANDLYRHPQEFSGGQRQRISIARGLIMEPEVLVCDEVVSALDVSVQGQIINLLSDLKKARNLSYIFITHDLRVASYFCDRIGVMYRGKVVEELDSKNCHKTCIHPYTKLLFEGAENVLQNNNTEVKSVLEIEKGCSFYDRCPLHDDSCLESCPSLREKTSGHLVRCHKV